VSDDLLQAMMKMTMRAMMTMATMMMTGMLAGLQSIMPISLRIKHERAK
jgi:hypothetical protein